MPQTHPFNGTMRKIIYMLCWPRQNHKQSRQNVIHLNEPPFTFRSLGMLLPHVLLKILGPLEGPATYPAREGPRFRVGGQVALQLVLAGTFTATHVALVA